jgi:hypothetical protein
MMKRTLVFLALLLCADRASAQIDSSLYNWFFNRYRLNGGETFQIWTGHGPDTIATKRYARQNGGGGGGGGTVGDTIMVRIIRADSAGVNWAQPGFLDSTGRRIRFEYMVKGWSDSAVIIGSSQYMAGKLPAINYVEGSMTAPDYPIPMTTAADTFQLYGFINGSRLFKGTPGDLNDFDVEFQLYIKNMESGDSTWMTVGYWYRSNQTGGFPPYFSNDTTAYTLSDWGGWGKITFGFQPYTRLRNGYPFYHTSWWVFGVRPNAKVRYRLKICYNGQTTVEDAYPRLYPTLASGRNVTFMVYQKPNYTVTDRWVTSAQMDSTTWTLGGSTIVNITNDLWVSNNITGGWGKFYRSLTVGSHIDSSGFETISDTIVGTINFYTDHGNVVTLRPGGHLNGTFVFPEVVHDGAIDSLLSQRDKLRAIPNSSVPIDTVEADSNITFIQVGHKLKIRGTTGAGATGASFYLSPGDKPPGSASAYNDEFDGANGTMIDTTSKWKHMGGSAYPNNTMTQGAGALIWSDTASVTGLFIKPIGQKLFGTDTVFTITIHLQAQARQLNYSYAGLFVYDSTSARGVWLADVYQATGNTGKYQDVVHFTTQKAAPSEAATGPVREAAEYNYLKIEKTIDRNLNFYVSTDGIGWSLFWTESCASYIESSGRINWVGIFTGCYDTAKNITADFYWFRYNWTFDYDPTLYH